jgi:hypothetical protein
MLLIVKPPVKLPCTLMVLTPPLPAIVYPFPVLVKEPTIVQLSAIVPVRLKVNGANSKPPLNCTPFDVKVLVPVIIRLAVPVVVMPAEKLTLFLTLKLFVNVI